MGPKGVQVLDFATALPRRETIMASLRRLLEYHLPELRRYAFLLTGSPDKGDELVAACLEAALGCADLAADPSPRQRLFRLFHESNHDIPAVEFRIEADAAPWGSRERMLNYLAVLSERERAILVLRGTLRFAEPEVAEILEVDEQAVRRTLADVRLRLARAALAHILIIEDDYLIASELASVVEQAGQEVCGPAATFDEAVRYAESCAPALVLADVQLRDGQFAGIAAADAIARKHATPVIFITAYPERLARGWTLQPLSVFSKPFEPDALRSLITRSLTAAAAAA